MNTKRKIISALTAALLVLNVFVPTNWSFADGTVYSLEKALEDGIMSKKPSLIVKQNGVELKADDNVNVNEEVQLVIKDLEIKILEKDSEPLKELVKAGDSIKIYLDTFVEISGTIPSANLNDGVGSVTFGSDANGMFALVKFSDDLNKSTENKVFFIQTDVTTHIHLNPDTVGNVTIGGKNFRAVKTPPAKEYFGEKEGTVIVSEQTAEWTITVNARKKSNKNPIELGGAIFSDLLSPDEVGELVEGSFSIDGVNVDKADYSYINNVLSYTFADNDARASVTIRFKTKLPDSKFFTHVETGQGTTGKNTYSAVSIPNTVKISDENGGENSITGSASFVPIWISKYGRSLYNELPVDNGGNVLEGRDETDKVSWYIEVNPEKIVMTNAVVKDELASELTFVRAAIQEKNILDKWVTMTDANGKPMVFDTNPVSYQLGNLDGVERRIVIVASGKRTQNTTYSNTATLTFDEFEGGKITSTDEATTGAGMLFKRRNTSINYSQFASAQGLPSNTALEWKADGLYAHWQLEVTKTHTLTAEKEQGKAIKVFDILYFNHFMKSSSEREALVPAQDSLPSEMKGKTGLFTQDYQGIGMRYVEDSFYVHEKANPSDDIKLEVHSIKNSLGEEIGQVLEFTGFSYAEASQRVHFSTKITDPSLLFPNTRTTFNDKNEEQPPLNIQVRNTGLLFVGDTYENYSSNRHGNDNHLLYKEVIPYSSVQGVSSDAYKNKQATTKEVGQKGAFNPQDGTVTFRISVNGSGRDIANTEIWKDGKFVKIGGDSGIVSIVDKLPKGWELVKMEDDAEFHLYNAQNVQHGDKKLSIEAEAKIADPSSIVELEKSVNSLEQTLSFDFKALKTPYVLIFKAKPSIEILRQYQAKTKTTDEISNQYAENKKVLELNTVTIAAENLIEKERVVDKQKIEIAMDTLEKKQVKDTGNGTVTWTINYKGRNASHFVTNPVNTPPAVPVELKDKLDSAIELLFNDRGEVDLSTITIRTYELTKDGEFGAVTSTIAEDQKKNYFSYDENTRELIFKAIDPSKNYAFSYTTVMVAEKDVVNAVTFVGNDENTNPATAKVTITGADIANTNYKVVPIQIVKYGKETEAAVEKTLLSGVTFQLIGSTNSVIRSKETDNSGYVNLGWLSPGTYTIKEIAPSGYKAMPTITINVTADSDGKIIAKTSTGQTITVDKPLEVINIKSSSNNGGDNNNNNNNSGGGSNTPTSPEVITDPNVPKTDPSTPPTDPSEVITDPNVPKSNADVNNANKGNNSKNANTKIAGAPKTGIGTFGVARELMMVGASGIVALLVADELLASRRKKEQE